MDHHIPTYLMWTVPHSGTRYVKTAFEREGLRAQHGYRWGAVDKLKPDLLWGHIDPDHYKGTLGEIASHVEQKFLVVRDPIDIWGTWMSLALGSRNPDDEVHHAMEALELHWEAQNELAQTGIHIHRVEEPLEDLGEWAGLSLTSHEKAYSIGKYPIKDAIAARDEAAIEAALLLTGGWKRFKRDKYLYEDLYTELGYNLWWTNG